jgi:PAS domain S-box-containing protein
MALLADREHGVLSDPRRLATLRSTGLLDAPASPILDRLTRAAARLVGTPIAIVSLIDDHRHVCAGSSGVPRNGDHPIEVPLSASICKDVVASGEPLVISDMLANGDYCTHPTTTRIGARAYAGLPLHAENGETLGVLCAIDRTERDWLPEQLESLRDLADAAEAELNLRIAHYRSRSNERRFRAFMDHSTVIASLISAERRVIYANAMFEWHFGIDPRDVIGKQLEAVPLPLTERLLTLHDSVRRQKHGVESIEEFVSARGEEKRWLVHAFPVDDGDAVSVGIVALDLSQQHHLERRLQQAQKLEAIGQLAAGVAHEINTPAQYVADNVRFLQQVFEDMRWLLADDRPRCADPGCALDTALRSRIPPDEARYLEGEVPRAFEQSLEGLSRVAAIVHSIKAFSHPGGKEAAYVDLNAAINNTLVVSRAEWKYVARAEVDLDPTLPLVRCHANEMNQVFLNLVVNAAHAMADKGKDNLLRVTTRADGDSVRIMVSDTGSGIPEAIRGRIFDPFFTTKPVGKGTGQGLAISHAVVEQHNGSLDFESVVGEGTTFTIRLPVSGPSERAGTPVFARALAQDGTPIFNRAVS